MVLATESCKTWFRDQPKGWTPSDNLLRHWQLQLVCFHWPHGTSRSQKHAQQCQPSAISCAASVLLLPERQRNGMLDLETRPRRMWGCLKSNIAVCWDAMEDFTVRFQERQMEIEIQLRQSMHALPCQASWCVLTRAPQFLCCLGLQKSHHVGRAHNTWKRNVILTTRVMKNVWTFSCVKSTLGIQSQWGTQWLCFLQCLLEVVVVRGVWASPPSCWLSLHASKP